MKKQLELYRLYSEIQKTFKIFSTIAQLKVQKNETNSKHQEVYDEQANNISYLIKIKKIFRKKKKISTKTKGVRKHVYSSRALK